MRKSKVNQRRRRKRLVAWHAEECSTSGEHGLKKIALRTKKKDDTANSSL